MVFFYSRCRVPRLISCARHANAPRSLVTKKVVFTGMGKMLEISVNNSTCPAHTQIASRTLHHTIFFVIIVVFVVFVACCCSYKS